VGFLGLGRAARPGVGNPNAGAGREALTAAGFRVDHKDSDQLRRLIQPWQSRSFSYYDQLGEIWYASQFYARMLSPLKLYAAMKNSDGDWEETEDPDAKDLLDRIRDPGGGDGDREGLLSSYGRLMFTVGEAYLLCSINEKTDLEQWEMLSTDELRVQSGTYIRYRAPTMSAQTLHEINDDDYEPIDPDTAVVYRLWKRHPRYSLLADAPMKGVLDLCEELLLLTRAVRARARSRLAGTGILAISEDFSHSPLEAVPDEDIDMDPFLRDLRDAMLAPIKNEGAASQIVPIVVRGPTAAIKDGIRHLQIVDPTQLYPETGLRYEIIKRIALGLDLPPEILLGLADANHWTGWIVDEQTWKAHGQPIANQLVNDLTTSYFLPSLREMNKPNWEMYAILYDASDVINHPDRGKDALDAYNARAIGKEALREAKGFDEADAPTPDELNEMIGVAVRDGSLALYGIPSVKAGGIEPEAGEVVSPSAGGTVGTPETGPQTGAEVEPGPPAGGANGNGNEPGEGAAGNLNAAAAARVAGAADLAVLRFREQAGNRIRSLALKDPELRELIEQNNVKARDIAAFLKRDRVRPLVGDEAELLGNARAVVEETFLMWDLPEAARALLLDQVERHALRTLYDAKPSPLPDQFLTYVSGVLAKG
jgi:hypothetical protein